MKCEEVIALGTQPASVVGSMREHVAAWRFAVTGHHLPLRNGWQRSIGMWGGIATLREIADHVGVTRATAHSYASYRQLRTRTRDRVRTQAQLALLALGYGGSAPEAAVALGVLPLEVVAYRLAAEQMRRRLGVSFRQILAWTPDRLEERWQALGLGIAYAEDVRRVLAAPSDAPRRTTRNERGRTPSTSEPEFDRPIEPPLRSSEDARRVGTLPPGIDLDALVREVEEELAAEEAR